MDKDVDPNTFNSSSATLTLPPEVTKEQVLWAGLYWGADLQYLKTASEQITPSPGCPTNIGFTINSQADYESCQANRVRLQTPTSVGYQTVIAEQFDFGNYGSVGRGRRYQGIADVTTLVKAGGNGTYTVANIQASSGSGESGFYGGWGLVVIYRDPTSEFGRIIVYDGFALVNNNRCLAINNITGFRTPESGNFAARLGMIAYEGDQLTLGDNEKFELNITTLVDASNPANNFFNSSISGPSTIPRNPNYTNNFGFDSDNLIITNAQNYFGYNATSANVTFCTGLDGYSPGLLTFSTQTQVADLRLSKTVDNPTPNRGSNVTFRLTLTNDGPDTATKVAVLDQLPAGLTFVSSTPSQGTYNNSTGIWTVGAVANKGVATLDIVATVTTTNPIVNTAQVSASDQPDIDSTPNNNIPSEDDQASVTVTGQESDLSISKSVDNLRPTGGDTIAYTITLTNNGPSNATGVQITDQLPSGLTYISDDREGAYNPTTGLWTVGTLNNGATITLTIRARVNPVNEVPNTGSTITNVARVSGSDQVDPNPDNNQDNEVIVPVWVPNLELQKRITRVNGTVYNQAEPGILTNWPPNFVRGITNPTNILPGDEVEYTIYFLSAGSAPLNNAVVCDPLQNFQTFLPNTFNGQTPTEGAFGAEVGIALAVNPPNPDLPTAYLRSANSASNRGRFYPSGITAPPACSLPNVRGAVVVDIGNLAAGDYGFIRFRVRID
ncbi:DUF11 domain-containing protein [Laspinema sp. D1]|uniref:DUF11 domain-containing protein n=1 Tax=Laspinema palackyanum D2a TaxID=2953684 RepID=A0ABT2MR52_9CYAN|nr:DUF11 domain-containing protein [Laspinema sp. D2a]